MDWRAKTPVPVRGSLPQLSRGTTDRTQKQLREQQAKQAAHCDTGAKDLRSLHTGERVWVQPSKIYTKQWQKAIVLAAVKHRS